MLKNLRQKYLIYKDNSSIWLFLKTLPTEFSSDEECQSLTYNLCKLKKRMKRIFVPKNMAAVCKCIVAATGLVLYKYPWTFNISAIEDLSPQQPSL